MVKWHFVWVSSTKLGHMFKTLNYKNQYDLAGSLKAIEPYQV